MAPLLISSAKLFLNVTEVRVSRVLSPRVCSIASIRRRSSTSGATKIDRLGEHPYGSRQYRLLDAVTERIIASIHAHRNIIYNANVTQEDDRLLETCRILLPEAVQDAGSNGEQPQSLATLHGLCDWVCEQGFESDSPSDTIRSLTEIQLEAVRAIATGVPRPGHSVVGPGTHRDAGDAWDRLAREFINSRNDSHDCECVLYKENGGQLVMIELLADTSPAYLQSAGGAMARFFIL